MSLNSRQQVTGDHTPPPQAPTAPNPATGHDTSFRIPANLEAHSSIQEAPEVGTCSLHSRAVQDLLIHLHCYLPR